MLTSVGVNLKASSFPIQEVSSVSALSLSFVPFLSCLWKRGKWTLSMHNLLLNKNIPTFLVKWNDRSFSASPSRDKGALSTVTLWFLRLGGKVECGLTFPLSKKTSSAAFEGGFQCVCVFKELNCICNCVKKIVFKCLSLGSLANLYVIRSFSVNRQESAKQIEEKKSCNTF